MNLYELKDLNTNFLISKWKTKKDSAQKILHQHLHYEILHIKANDTSPSYFRVRNTEYAFNSNSILLTPPNTKHMTIRKTKNTTRTLICIRPNFLEPIADFAGINLDILFNKYTLNYSNKQILHIQNLSLQILEEFKTSTNPENDSYLRILIALLLHELSQYESVAEPIIIKENSIYDIIDYIKYNYFENITLDMMSQKFNISKYDICRRLKTITKYTFNEFLTNVRINKARELLETTQIPIIAIAERIGYNSASYFTKAFKAHIGQSPTEYRDIYRSNKHTSAVLQDS